MNYMAFDMGPLLMTGRKNLHNDEEPGANIMVSTRIGEFHPASSSHEDTRNIRGNDYYRLGELAPLTSIFENPIIEVSGRNAPDAKLEAILRSNDFDRDVGFGPLTRRNLSPFDILELGGGKNFWGGMQVNPFALADAISKTYLDLKGRYGDEFREGMTFNVLGITPTHAGIDVMLTAYFDEGCVSRHFLDKIKVDHKLALDDPQTRKLSLYDDLKPIRYASGSLRTIVLENGSNSAQISRSAAFTYDTLIQYSGLSKVEQNGISEVFMDGARKCGIIYAVEGGARSGQNLIPAFYLEDRTDYTQVIPLTRSAEEILKSAFEYGRWGDGEHQGNTARYNRSPGMVRDDLMHTPAAKTIMSYINNFIGPKDQ
ncbi:MAG: hypothetical protein NDI94_05720 [Candidatus Woesearchaeota archaeon]|nr:hypothetical protein [Candidatus Woesearchaeota archaeon]